MLNVPVRLALIPATLATGLGMTPVTSASEPAHLTAPAVRVEEVLLTGIGQDIYYAITPYVQTAVGGVSYLINFLPLGGLPAAQINICYFQGIQPSVEATVNYLAAVVQDPFDFVAQTAAYGSALYDIGYNWVSAELQFLGLEPLPLLGSVGSGDRARTAATGDRPGSTGQTSDLRPRVAVAQRERSRALRAGGEARQSRQNMADSPRSARFGRAQSQAVPSLGPAGQAPLAQSAERFHGKEKVNGSIPLGGSVDAGRTGGAEHMAV